MTNDLNSVEIVKALEIAVRSLADGITAMDSAITQVLAERKAEHLTEIVPSEVPTK